jgi:acetyl-CoA carboxylase biotin carboxyl carrier protein
MTNPLDHIDQLSTWLATTDIGLLELKGPTGTLRLLHDGSGEIRSIDQEEAPRLLAPALVVRTAGVGIFLDRHPLGGRPLAAVGAEVLGDAPLGFLQVGPLLTPVPAPRAGIVTDVLVEHGQIVGYGTPLFEMQPIGSNVEP